MLSSHLTKQVNALVPSLKNTGQSSVFLGLCPFHTGKLSSLVVDFGANSASCLTCGYGKNIPAMVGDLLSQETSSSDSSQRKPRPVARPPVIGSSYGYLLTKEVSQAIHHHLFSSKVKELNSAVKQLAQLVSLMKLWIDPA